ICTDLAAPTDSAASTDSADRAGSPDRVDAAERGLGGAGYVGLPSALRGATVDFAGWQAIDRHERATAPELRLRRKIRSTEELLRLALARQEDTSISAGGTP
ncbi:hypothetical protein ACFPZL_09880, partial [Leucobacter soli]